MSANGAGPSDERSLEATSRIEAVLLAIRDSGSLSAASAEGARRLATAGAEQSASGTQLLTALESIASLLETAYAASQDLTRGQQTLTDGIGSLQQSLDAGAGSAGQMSATSEAIRKETLELVASTEATAATLEETARSIKGVGANAEELAAATEELLAATTEAASTNEDMALRGQSNAAAVEEMAATIEEMSKGIQRLASDAQAVNERVGGVMTLRGHGGQSAQGVAGGATEMAGAVESTSVTTEELARSFRTVAEPAKQLESAAQTTASNVTEVAGVRRRGGGDGRRRTRRRSTRRPSRSSRWPARRGRSRRASRPSPSSPSRAPGRRPSSRPLHARSPRAATVRGSSASG